MAVIELTSANFKEVIAEGITVVDFWAPWCGPCKMIAPSINELAEEDSSTKYGKLDIDQARDIATEYEVMSIPTLIYFKDGKEVDRTVGVLTKAAIADKVKGL